MFDNKLILERIADYKKIEGDNELRDYLGLSRSNYTKFKNKITNNYDIILAKGTELDLNYVFFGRDIYFEYRDEISRLKKEMAELKETHKKEMDRISEEDAKIKDLLAKDAIRKMYRLKELIEDQEPISVADEDYE